MYKGFPERTKYSVKQNRVKKIFLNIIKTIALLVVVYILFFVLSKLTTGSSFGTWNSFSIILQQSMLNALVGWAMSFNIFQLAPLLF